MRLVTRGGGDVMHNGVDCDVGYMALVEEA